MNSWIQKINNFKAYKKNPIFFMSQKSHENELLTPVHLPNKTIFVTANAELTRFLSKQARGVISKGKYYHFLKKILGNSLITIDGEEWIFHRKIISPYFNNEHFTNYFNKIKESTRIFLRDLEYEDKSIYLVKGMQNLSFYLICNSLFHLESISKNKYLVQKICNVLKLINQSNTSLLPFWLKPLTIKYYKIFLHSFLIKNKFRKTLLNYKINTEENTLLDYLLTLVQNSEISEVSHSFVLDEIITLTIAGFKTTSSTLSWLLYLLAKHRFYQDQLYSEIQEKLPKNYDFNKLKELNLTKNIIFEALRLYPAVFTLPRNINQPLDYNPNLKFKKNTTLFISIVGLHTNPLYWTKPNEFIPERFNDYKEIKNKNIYMPFGLSNRSCIGANFALMEIEILLIEIFREYTISIDNNYIPKPLASIDFSIANDTIIHFSKRKNVSA